MSYKIYCSTLFDITQTGVLNRQKPEVDFDVETWLHRRNTQCNFDTVIQAISLRSQPENITVPILSLYNFKDMDYFGYLFENEQPINFWTFEFTIQHPIVYHDGISELGSLYSDCDSVPMIKTQKCWDKLPSFLDISDEMRNIYFKLYEKNDE